MATESNNLEMVVNVNATLHLNHTDVPEPEHRTEQVSGRIQTDVSTGLSNVSLDTLSGTKFRNMTSLGCVIVIIADILRGKKDKKKQKKASARTMRHFTDSTDLLELSPNGYSAHWKIYFDGEDNFAEKRMSITLDREEDGVRFYTESIETIHHYPKSLSNDLVQILPNDILLFNGETRGTLQGYTDLRWLKSNNDILVASAEIEITLLDDSAELSEMQLYSYYYRHGTTDNLPFNIQILKDDGIFENEEN